MSSRAQVQCIERISPPGSSCPSLDLGRCEYPRLSEESEKESRDEATQMWRRCTKNNVEADESHFVLNPAADWQPVDIVKKRSDVGRSENFENEAS